MTLHDRQIALEEEMLSMGIDRYNSIKEERLEDTHPARRLLMANVERIAATINERMDEYKAGKAGRYAKTVLALLEQCEPEAATYIAFRRVLHGQSGGREAMTTCAVAIGGLIEEHIVFTQFQYEQRSLANWWQERAKRSEHAEHRQKVMRAGVRASDSADFDWSEEEKLKVGSWMLELLEDYGIIERHSEKHGRTTRYVLEFRPEIKAHLDSQHADPRLITPFMMPMIVPPKPWTTPFDGGYLLRRKRVVTGSVPRSYFDDLASADLTDVYSALNSVQSTAWKVNRSILNVVQDLRWAPAGMPGLPGPDAEAMPLRPAHIPTDVRISELPEEQQRELKAWRGKTKDYYDLKAANESRRKRFMTTMWVAEKFVDEEEIYFPHLMDSRGRIYSMPVGLSPQGDDLTKSLLHFANGTELGDNGAYWLAVHTANSYGEDKITFDERVQWVLDNEDMILEVGMNPSDTMDLWACADKPWQFLASALEWTGYVLAGRSDDYVSHLPIGLDGSCSGLQHFSAALRDEVGGRAVNLIPTGKVEDVYTEVLNRVQLRLDASTCDDNLRVWQGHIDRKLVKQPCMTYAYSSTLAGMRDMLVSVLKDRQKKGLPMPEGNVFENCVNLAPVVREAIEETVIAASEAMSWLQQVSSIATDAGKAIRWTTPVGLPVLQMRMETVKRQSSLWYQGVRLKLALMNQTKRISKSQQKNAIAPNWIHSMDASHLMDVVNNCVDHGITDFGMVHDSFAVPAGRVDELFTIIRLTFIEQYRSNRLEEFRDGLVEQLGDDVELPPLPDTGDLDLELVSESDYFFA